MKPIYILLMMLAASCGSDQERKMPPAVTVKSTTMTTITDTTQSITIETTVLKSMRIIYISGRIPLASLRQFFADSYGELFAFITQQHLQAGKVMAFYGNYNDPIDVDVAVEVNMIPSTLTRQVMTRTVEGGNAVVVHYKGPYNEMVEPYSRLTQWLGENGKEAKGLPFEVYLNSPVMVKDSTELLTDIYQLLK